MTLHRIEKTVLVAVVSTRSNKVCTINVSCCGLKGTDKSSMKSNFRLCVSLVDVESVLLVTRENVCMALNWFSSALTSCAARMCLRMNLKMLRT